MNVQAIEGIITLADGSTSKFLIGTDYGWSQWGADTQRVGLTVDVMEAIVDGLKDAEVNMSDEEEDEDTSEPCDWFVNSATVPAWCCNTHMFDGTNEYPATGEHPVSCNFAGSESNPEGYTHRAGTPLNIDLGAVIDIDGERRVYLPHYHLGKTWCETYEPVSGIGVSDGWTLDQFDFTATGETVDPTRYMVELYSGGALVAEVASFLSLASAEVWAADMRGSTLGYVLTFPGASPVNRALPGVIIDGADVSVYTSTDGPGASTVVYKPEA